AVAAAAAPTPVAPAFLMNERRSMKSSLLDRWMGITLRKSLIFLDLRRRNNTRRACQVQHGRRSRRVRRPICRACDGCHDYSLTQLAASIDGAAEAHWQMGAGSPILAAVTDRVPP